MLTFVSPQACEIHFDNTPIPVENVLGKVGGGFKVLFAIPYPFQRAKKVVSDSPGLVHFAIALG